MILGVSTVADKRGRQQLPDVAFEAGLLPGLPGVAGFGHGVEQSLESNCASHYRMPLEIDFLCPHVVVLVKLERGIPGSEVPGTGLHHPFWQSDCEWVRLFKT